MKNYLSEEITTSQEDFEIVFNRLSTNRAVVDVRGCNPFCTAEASLSKSAGQN